MFRSGRRFAGESGLLLPTGGLRSGRQATYQVDGGKGRSDSQKSGGLGRFELEDFLTSSS